MPLTECSYLELEKIAHTQALASGTVVAGFNPSTNKDSEPNPESTSDFISEKKYYCNILNGLSEAEFGMFKKIVEAHSRLFNEFPAIGPVNVLKLMHAFNLYRTIRSVSPPETSSVLEIAPGPGYLGSILALAGYRYFATEQSHQYYLFQNRMWQHLFGNRFLELASQPEEQNYFQGVKADTVAHLPWWKYAKIDQQSLAAEFDLVIAQVDPDKTLDTIFVEAMRQTADAFGTSQRMKFFLLDSFDSGTKFQGRNLADKLGLKNFNSVLERPYTNVFVSQSDPGKLSKSYQYSTTEAKKIRQAPFVPVAPLQAGKIQKPNFKRMINPLEIMRLSMKSIRMVMAPGGYNRVTQYAKSYLYGTSLAQLIPPLPSPPLMNIPSIQHLRNGAANPSSSMPRPIGNFAMAIKKGQLNSWNSKVISYREMDDYRQQIIEPALIAEKTLFVSSSENATNTVNATKLDFLFMHASKVGGSCVKKFLDTLYPDLCRHNHANFPQLHIPQDWVLANLEWLMTICPYKAMITNYYVAQDEINWDGPPPVTLTILRDPIERICSEFLEYRETVSPYIDMAGSDIVACFRDVITFSEHFHRNNFFVRFFSRTDLIVALRNDEYDLALCNLRSISCVGFTNDMERVIDTLCTRVPTTCIGDTLGARNVAIGMIRDQSLTAGAQMAERLAPSAREHLLEANSMDYRLFETIKRESNV